MFSELASTRDSTGTANHAPVMNDSSLIKRKKWSIHKTVKNLPRHSHQAAWQIHNPVKGASSERYESVETDMMTDKGLLREWGVSDDTDKEVWTALPCGTRVFNSVINFI